MLTQFNDSVRRVMSLADQEAQRLRHDYIATEHLLLAMLRLGDSLGARVIGKLGASPAEARAAVEKIVQLGPHQHCKERPLTPRARQVLRYAAEAAERLGHERIGTGHLLLGLMQEKDGVAHHVLRGLEVQHPGRSLCELVEAEHAEQVVAEMSVGYEEPLPDLPPHLRRALDDPEPEPAAALAGPKIQLPIPRPGPLRLDPYAEDRAGDRLLGAAGGALAGLCWSLLVSVPLMVLFWGKRGPGFSLPLAIATSTTVIAVFIGAITGAHRARKQTLADDYAAIAHKHTRRAAFRALLFSVPAALFLVWCIGPFESGAAVMSGLLVVGLFVGSAAIIGYARGTKEALAQHRRDSEAALAFVASAEADEQLERWEAGTLAERRRALEHAIAARFGPLGEDARERLQTWEQDRLVEAGKNLAQAQSPGELGLED
jgi:hypothetical protein